MPSSALLTEKACTAAAAAAHSARACMHAHNSSPIGRRPPFGSVTRSWIWIRALRVAFSSSLEFGYVVLGLFFPFPNHSDSLDTLLYVRFAIQNLEFYEWKLGDHGWALSWHRTHTLFSLWPDVTSCFTYEKTEREEVFSIVSYIRFKNLQFHWRIYNSIGVCILMRGVQWALWFVTSSWSECLSDQRFAAKLCARWAAKRRLISNVRHGEISLLILANKPSSFS